ncbi:capsule assembly Wzi family protein [Pseudocolwellia agarivorans]|uniref:capsule assembly Wzi family protein n=1 Tax=Pseudocolwellia agarivorans TaxID=1911682 RepID=UPI003F881DD5
MKKYLSLIALLSLPSVAEPWVDTSNIFLRAQIQYLSDVGIIKTPTTTYPLMWGDIAKDLNNVAYRSLNESSENAYHYVMNQLRLAKRNQKTIELNASLEDKRFTSFGDDFRDKNNISIHTTWMTDSFAVKLSTSYNPSPIDGDKVRYDGSYLAGYIGNWVVSVGMQDRWWGPGWDSSLALSNNARPIPALALSRKSAEPFVIPFTDYGIPWTVTSFMGVMDDERVIEDTLLWGFRLNFKPFENLEIGISRLAQWGGEGRPQGSSTFWNVLLGKDNCGAGGLDCGENRELEPGNQQAGYDLRYSFNLFDTPLSLYGQYYAEDGDNNSSFGFLTEPVTLVGIDSHIRPFNTPTTVYFEFTDTFADCSDGDLFDNGNCFNEHHIYQTGMRYNLRAIGNIYDNDAKALVLGSMSELGKDTHLELKLRKLQLNYDNSDKAPNNPIIGNPLTPIAEDMVMLSAKVQHSYKNWRFTVGSSYSQSSFDNDIKDDTDFNGYLNIEYNL